MSNKFFQIYFIIIFSVLNLSNSSLTKLSLNQTVLGYLHPQTYAYYELSIKEEDSENKDFLLIEARRNKEQDILDNIYSDPNLYVSNFHSEPGPNKNEWSSDRFGDEVISINKINTYSNKIFYISIYCQFSCNFALKATLFKNYEMKGNKLYTISMIPFDIIKFTLRL